MDWATFAAGATIGASVVALMALVYTYRRDRASVRLQGYVEWSRPEDEPDGKWQPWLVITVVKVGMTPVEIESVGVGWSLKRHPGTLQHPTSFVGGVNGQLPKDLQLTFSGQASRTSIALDTMAAAIRSQGLPDTMRAVTTSGKVFEGELDSLSRDQMRSFAGVAETET
jgi:hypothetical protein